MASRWDFHHYIKQAENPNGENPKKKKKSLHTDSIESKPLNQQCQNRKLQALYQFPLLRRVRTSASVGSAGIAPFLVVVMAPQAQANLSTSLNLGSSCKIRQSSPTSFLLFCLLISSYYNRIRLCEDMNLTIKEQAYLQDSLVINNFVQESSNKGVTSTSCIDSIHMKSTYGSMKIL